MDQSTWHLLVLANNAEVVRLDMYFYEKKSKSKNEGKDFDLRWTIRTFNVFSREYDMRWSGKLFSVVKRFRRSGIPVYSLVDYIGENIEGIFYESELQKVEVRNNDIQKIQSIFKLRGFG